jgi:hypothetical protein
MLMLINPSSLGAVIFPLTRCLNAGAEDFIVNPLQSKEVQHLWNCSTAMRPSKGAALFEAIVAKRNNKPLVLPPSDAAVGTAIEPCRSRHGTYVAPAATTRPRTERLIFSSFL